MSEFVSYVFIIAFFFFYKFSLQINIYKYYFQIYIAWWKSASFEMFQIK